MATVVAIVVAIFVAIVNGCNAATGPVAADLPYGYESARTAVVRIEIRGPKFDMTHARVREAYHEAQDLLGAHMDVAA